MKTTTPSLAHLAAEVAFDHALLHWREFDPKEVGDRCVRYVEARQKFRAAVTT